MPITPLAESPGRRTFMAFGCEKVTSLAVLRASRLKADDVPGEESAHFAWFYSWPKTFGICVMPGFPRVSFLILDP